MSGTILQARVSLGEGLGCACGPFGLCVVASVQYSDSFQHRRWLHCVEIEGLPSFYVSEDDIHDALVTNPLQNEAFWENVNSKNLIGSLNGLPLGEYSLMFRGFDESPGNIAIPLLRYLIFLVRCPMEMVQPLIDGATGKNIDEIGISMSDIEEEYRNIA